MPSLLAILGLNSGPFKAGLNDAQNMARQFGSSIGEHLKGSLAGVVGVAGIEETIRRTIEWGESVFDTASKLGLTIEQVQRLDYALKLSGSALLEHTRFFEMLSVARDKANRGVATPEQNQAFKTFGISAADLQNKNVNLVSLMADAVERGMDQDRLMASLRALGGRGAATMAEAFKMGLGDLMKDAPVVSDESIRKLKEAGDSIKEALAEFRAGFAPVLTFVMDKLAGAFHGLATIVNGIVGTMSEAFRQSFEIIAHPLKSIAEIKKGQGGFGIGESLKAGRDQALDYVKSIREAKEARESAMNKALSRHPSGDSPEVAEAKKVLELRQRLFDAQQANDLKALSREGQLLELNRRRSEILEAMKHSQTEEGRLNAAIDIEKLDSEIRGLTSSGSVEALKEKHRGGSSHGNLNALQMIGAYASQTDPSHETLKRIEAHVRDLKKPKTHSAWHGPSFH